MLSTLHHGSFKYVKGEKTSNCQKHIKEPEVLSITQRKGQQFQKDIHSLKDTKAADNLFCEVFFFVTFCILHNYLFTRFLSLLASKQASLVSSYMAPAVLVPLQ